MKNKKMEMVEWMLNQDRDPYNKRLITDMYYDLAVLDIIKKFFVIEAYSDKRLNADFCKITAIEDKEANIDRSALSFIDGDSLKILKKWLRGVKNANR